MTKHFYITTTLPYVNADPHIGFALEIIQADVLARFHKLMDDQVIFNTGTDEHGQKIYQKALEQSLDPKEYCDIYAAKFENLKNALNLSYTNFIRTTDEQHIKAAQKFWLICKENGDIYKKLYKIKYCVGCELEKTDSELENGHCLLHPNLELEIREEENYFFKFSKYQDSLLKFYEKNPDFVIPESRFNEIKSFVKNGLEDFSISRLKEKMPWGIDVPGDPKHVMYVWFDALINYISTIDWPEDMKEFEEYWPVVQFAGKDQVRQQAAMWQSMLMSAKISGSKQIFIHGFMTIDGQKISKSLGNVINPIEVVEKYGTDALRYYLLAKIHPTEDSDFSWEKFKESYNADLANGLGNLVARVAKLAEKIELHGINKNLQIHENVPTLLKDYKFNEILDYIWSVELRKLDQEINEVQPWKIEDQEKLKEFLGEIISNILDLAYNLQPFLPETAEKIIKQFTAEKIIFQKPLFPRI